MEFIIGKDKFLLIKFDDNAYTHIFPVTKYQFERYIWDAAPENLDYDEIIRASPRLSPHEITEKNLKQLFVTNISLNEALGYAKWEGGRVPTVDEKKNICEAISQISINDIFNYCDKNKDLIDQRFLFIHKLQEVGVITIKDLYNILDFDEFFTELPKPIDDNYGDVYVGKLYRTTQARILGKGVERVSVKGDFGFRVILEDD